MHMTAQREDRFGSLTGIDQGPAVNKLKYKRLDVQTRGVAPKYRSSHCFKKSFRSKCDSRRIPTRRKTVASDSFTISGARTREKPRRRLPTGPPTLR